MLFKCLIYTNIITSKYGFVTSNKISNIWFQNLFGQKTSTWQDIYNFMFHNIQENILFFFKKHITIIFFSYPLNVVVVSNTKKQTIYQNINNEVDLAKGGSVINGPTPSSCIFQEIFSIVHSWSYPPDWAGPVIFFLLFSIGFKIFFLGFYGQERQKIFF